MSKERLEEIIHKEAYLEGTNNLVMVISTEDYKWLIEQAEQKQSLETTVDFYQSALRDADRRVQELEDVNSQPERQAPGIELELLNMELTDALKQNKRYREALEFYAEPKNWLPQNEDVLSLITMDYGEKARQTLEGEE